MCRVLMLVASLIFLPATPIAAAELVGVPIESVQLALAIYDYGPSCYNLVQVSLNEDTPIFTIDPACGGGTIRLENGKITVQDVTSDEISMFFDQERAGSSAGAMITTPQSGTGIVPLIFRSDFSTEMRPVISSTAGGSKLCSEAGGGGPAASAITCSALAGDLTKIQWGSNGIYVAPIGPGPQIVLEVMTSAEVGTVSLRSDLAEVTTEIATLTERIGALEAADAEQDTALAGLATSDAEQSSAIDTLTAELVSLETRVQRLEKKLFPPKHGCGTGAELAFLLPAIVVGVRRRAGS
jgi:uncharacterized coiled-coil protein SlyX